MAERKNLRMPADEQEGQAIFHRWNRLNGRYYIHADVVLNNGAYLRDVTFDSDSGIAVEVQRRPVTDVAEWFGLQVDRWFQVMSDTTDEQRDAFRSLTT